MRCDLRTAVVTASPDGIPRITSPDCTALITLCKPVTMADNWSDTRKDSDTGHRRSGSTAEMARPCPAAPLSKKSVEPLRSMVAHAVVWLDGIRTKEKIAERAPQQVGDAPPCQMVRAVVDQGAALAKASEVTRPIVCWVVIEVRRGKNDTRVPDAGCLLEVRPAGGPTAAIAPGARGGVIPAAVGQAANCRSVRPPACLTAAAGALEPYLPADLWPVDRVEPAQLRLDRHRGSPSRGRPVGRAGDRRWPGRCRAGGRSRRAELLVVAQPVDLAGVDLWLAALVNAARFRGTDPLQLPLAAQIGLEFGEHAEHVEERLARGSAGVDRLLGRLQRDGLGLQLVNACRGKIRQALLSAARSARLGRGAGLPDPPAV